MYCTNCGAELADDSKFCSSCGAACTTATGASSSSYSYDPNTNTHTYEEQYSNGQTTEHNTYNYKVDINVEHGDGSLEANEKKINKHIFVWVGTFLFGNLGVDRFMRGQIGLGILKLITIGACGIWGLVDWIIALCKAYGGSFGSVEDIVFRYGKYAR